MSNVTEVPLPERIIKWIIASVSDKASVQSIRQLQGGRSSLVHEVSLEVDEEIQEFVVRQFDNKEWLQEEPDLVLHEARSLNWATSAGLAAPEIIAFDETGSESGLPAVLMTKLEGSVVLEPFNMSHWLDGLADSLVQIHKVSADVFPWRYFTYNDLPSLQTPSWSSLPEQWGKAISIVKGPRPKVKECFIHRDYHPANVLWSKNAVSGVVDWVNACRGPAGIDVGHCRLNLAQLHGVKTAEAFLNAYQKYAGSTFDYDPYWDILSVIDILFGPPTVYKGWTDLGMTGLTDELMRERLDAYMRSLLDKI